jgi:hypothetical protein
METISSAGLEPIDIRRISIKQVLALALKAGLFEWS